METTPPEVSVVMAVYNGQKYLRDAVDSILSQTFRDFEFIIVNDGSTDLSGGILETYSDERIKIINQSNQGLPIALNKALTIASGKYICRMDADDIAFPNRLSIQHSTMEKNEKIDVLGGQAYRISNDGSHVGVIAKPVSIDNARRYVQYGCALIHPTYFVRARVYRKLNGYREILVTGQDYDFLLRAITQGFNLANVPERILNYRESLEGISSENLLKQKRVTRILLKLYKQRLHKGGELCETLLELKEALSQKQGTWFKRNYMLRQYFLARSKKRNTVAKIFFLSMVAIVSLFHYELFLSGWRARQALKWLDQ